MATSNLTSGEQHALDVLMALPEDEATRVALAALEQRGDAAWKAPDHHSEHADDAFISELGRRVQAVEAGTATLTAAQEVYAQLDAKLAPHA